MAGKHVHDMALAGHRGASAAPGTGIPDAVHGSAEDARQRLAASAEHRTVTSGGVAGPFIPTCPPAFIAELFAESARAVAVLASALPHHELPPYGLEVSAPSFTVGPSVSDPAEAAATSTTDFTSSPRLPQYVAALFGRRPEAVTVISGSGLSTPTFA
jgi:hypothetical protein